MDKISKLSKFKPEIQYHKLEHINHLRVDNTSGYRIHVSVILKTLSSLLCQLDGSQCSREVVFLSMKNNFSILPSPPIAPPPPTTEIASQKFSENCRASSPLQWKGIETLDKQYVQTVTSQKGQSWQTKRLEIDKQGILQGSVLNSPAYLYPTCLSKARSTATHTNIYHANPLRKTKQAKCQGRTLTFN